MTLVSPPNAQLPLVDLKTGAPALGSGGLAFLQKITTAINGTSGVVAPGIVQVTIGIGIKISAGSGNPAGVVVGNPGDIYLNLSGGTGTTLFVKESATDATGWVGK